MSRSPSHFHEQLDRDADDAIDARSHNNNNYDPSDAQSTRGLLSPQSPYTPSESTAYDPHSGPVTPYTSSIFKAPEASAAECEAKHGYRRDHGAFGSVSILVLAVYSTIFSGIWLALASAKPQYSFIRTSGGLSPSAASTMVAAFAKSIELAFVTVFVAFIGQYLSRAALDTSGITIADMQLRSFVLQPGLIIKSWHSFRSIVRTLLGIATLLATLGAVLYTTASDALVSPKPSLGRWQPQNFTGYVQTDFANNSYLENLCPTPITETLDPDSGGTCTGIEHSGQAFHNFMQYLTLWHNASSSNNDTVGTHSRPSPVGMLYDNTTVQGVWTNSSGPDIVNTIEGRTFNNVTMIMPHSGVYAAALDKANMLSQFQTEDVNYQFVANAQVASPAVNVMCVNATAEDLRPLIWSEWPINAELYSNGNQTIPSTFAENRPPDWYNSSALDTIFGFNKAYKRPPLFGKIPKAYNTVFDPGFWGSNGSVYLITTTNLSTTADEPQLTQHTMCSLHMTLEPGCSTQFQFEISGGNLSSDCSTNNPMAHQGHTKEQLSWSEVAGVWGLAISLNTGINDENGSIGRLLSQLVSADGILPLAQPTLAEGLAVLAGCTLMNSGIGAPFTEDQAETSFENWDNGTLKRIANAGPQAFPARVMVAKYKSGGSSRWENIFTVVLTVVFLLSMFCLVYFCHMMRIRGLVSDFIEPDHIFALALASPPDTRLAGAAASGPNKTQLQDKWFIRETTRHQVFIGDGKKRGHTSWVPSVRRRPVANEDFRSGVDKEEIPQAYKPTMGDGIKRSIGGLGLELKTLTGRK